MATITSEGSYLLRIITTHCFVTCIYLPATIILLVYFNNLCNIGRYSLCYKLLLGLMFAEFVKHSITYFSKSELRNQQVYNRKNVKCKDVFKLMFIIAAMTVIYYFVAVLFGAQVFDEQEQTLMFSSLLSVLTVIPSCINLGVEKTFSIFSDLAAFQGDLMSEIILRNIQFTLVGAWVGAFVIPLDWDREWQKWPIPCSLGALIGYFFAHVFTLVCIIFKSHKFFGKKTGKYSL